MYIVIVDRREYSPISQRMEVKPDIDTIYEANDLDAYEEGFISFYAYQRTNEMVKNSNRLMTAKTFVVLNKEGLDITYLLSEKQKDSIQSRVKYHN
ncbi:MAG TPA: hypothetical protein VFX43_08100 [Chitinophagaceae bacterium]|nr:hypothetical protein [Chitinophagaceae bacterium]